MSKSLSESAAEILKTSLSGAGKDSMKDGGAQYDDLGGQTPTSGPDAIGKKKSALAKEAPKPEVKGDAKSVKTQANEEATTDEEVVAEEELTADAEVIAEEEVELTEEEIDAYLDSLSEEELAELVAEAEALEEQGMTGLSLPLNKGVKAPYKKGSTVANPKMAEEVELTEEEIAEARKTAVKDLVQKNMSSCKEDVDALFNGEQLSEEFRNKATTIFEAAVRARVEAIATQIVEENEKILAESVDAIQEDLSEQVDGYLNHVVEGWMEENQLAVETGLKVEITEDFINGLKNLFAENYIEVPEDKADIVEEMAEAVLTAEEKLAEETAKVASLTKSLNEAKATEILRKICEGLTEVQVSKIKSLAEGVEFTTDGEYTEKLAVIRESYYPSGKAKAAAPEVVVETAEEAPEGKNSVMDYYVNAITKQLPK